MPLPAERSLTQRCSVRGPGSFRLGFGVWVPQITRGKQPRGAWINEYNCDLRATIGWVMTGQHVDFWWSLRDPEAQSAALNALVSYGLPG